MNSQQLVSRFRRWFLGWSENILALAWAGSGKGCDADAMSAGGGRNKGEMGGFDGTTLSWLALCLLCGSLCSGPASASSAAEAAAPVSDQCLAVEQAFAANDVEALSALAPESARWEALRNFRLAAIYIPLDNKREARRAVRAGLSAVRSGIDALDDTASPTNRALETELLLLGAMLDGQFLLIDRWRLFRNGFRGLRRLQRAERVAPGNTRALLVRGTAKVVAPWALGGSAEEAVQIFRRADLSAPLCAGGEWAQVDVLNWLGRAYAKLDQSERAQDAFQRALERSPDNHWVLLALAGEGYEWTEHGAEDSDARPE